MPNLNHNYREPFVINLAHNPVVPKTVSPEFSKSLPCQRVPFGY